MKYTTSVLSLIIAGASAFAPPISGSRHKITPSIFMSEEATTAAAPVVATTSSDSKEALEALAVELNPVVKYYDPLGLADMEFWGQSTEATIGFLRHAEIKHGRVAMAAFVGYCVQSNFVFPWAQTLAGAPHPSPDLGPEAQWDAVPANAKWQILVVIAALELWDETGGGSELSHYMRGRQPGKYPTFQLFRDQVHFVLDLYDPFGFNKKMKEDVKQRRLVAEINNGRLAMLGIFGFLSADKVEGSVPLLKNIAIPYDGEVMAPFSGVNGEFSLFQ